MTGQVEFDRVIGHKHLLTKDYSALMVRNLAVSTAFVFVSYSGVTKIAAVARKSRTP